MLRTRATAEQLRTLHAALARFAAEDSLGFDKLFDPATPHTRVQPPSPQVVPPLWAFGLVEGQIDELWGLHRIRRIEDRFYLLELGLGDEKEYVQDVWPETDAMLARLAGAPPGRLLDLGTGCGVVAIEAARRGHRVVATDLYESALDLARFNARLNAVEGIDFWGGHLFEAVGGERFDLVLTAPHYGRTSDQLRLEVLCGSLSHLVPGGTLCLATALEWEEGAPLGVESALSPLVATGARVEVEPIEAALKRSWFSVAESVEPVPRLVSRHRFTVTVTAPSGPGAGALRVERPQSVAAVPHVPLARLTRRPDAVAAIVDAADVQTLRAILEALRHPDARFDAPLPRQLLDACRFGARACADAAGAILDEHGAVRPCTHGAPVARVDAKLAQVLDALAALGREAEARRGCPRCPARAVCSRCLFPFALDEATYCDLVRAHAAELPLLHRLIETVRRLEPAAGPLEVQRWPRAAALPEDALGRRWNQLQTWIVRHADHATLSWLDEAARLVLAPVDDTTVLIGALVADGRAGAVAEELRTRRLPERMGARALEQLRGLLSA